MKSIMGRLQDRAILNRRAICVWASGHGKRPAAKKYTGYHRFMGKAERYSLALRLQRESV